MAQQSFSSIDQTPTIQLPRAESGPGKQLGSHTLRPKAAQHTGSELGNNSNLPRLVRLG